MKTNTSALIVPAPSSATNNPATNALAADIRDIKAPVDIPSGWFWLGCVLGALGIALASYLAWRYWRKHRATPRSAEVIVPPHERARRKLREALKLIYDSGPFCVAVSDTLRSYLEEAFSLRAPERTTEEFLDELQTSALLSLSQKQSLADFLMRCDLVKFARDEPTVEQLQALHESALRLVDETSYFQSRPTPSTDSGEPSQPQPPPLTPEASAGNTGSEPSSQIADRKS